MKREAALGATYLLTLLTYWAPGRTDKNLCRCFGAPACRVFPDHLITGARNDRRGYALHPLFIATYYLPAARRLQ